MAKVKICGIRRQEDIDGVNRIKPDFIGFIFAKSKRQITPDLAYQLGKNLDKNIKKVGVFVNEPLESLLQTYEEANLDIIQLHGDESFEYVDMIPEGIEIWKAVRVRDEKDILKAEQYAKSDKISAVLLDAYDEREYGGLGVSFDWNLIKRQIFKNLVLAGGLNSDNIVRAVQICSPDIVDVSSGVETDGYKDYNKMNDFVLKVRNIYNG